MASYRTYTSCTDVGPYISKLVLELPGPVRDVDVVPGGFSVYGERRDRETGVPVMAKEHRTDPDELARPSAGYIEVLAAYPADDRGARVSTASHVALELPEERASKPIDGTVLSSCLRDMAFTVTQTAFLPSADEGSFPIVGQVWDRCAGDICPDLEGWDLSLSGVFDGVSMGYGLFSPDLADAPRETVPLLLWLHGAGEGGGEPYRTVTGNKVTALSGAQIQAKLGGACYVLAPSCPTFWMDSGSGTIEDDNRSVYSAAVMELVHRVMSGHPDIDPDRVYVGGLSNGGFMAMRLVADNPGFFAAAVPVCAPWVGDLGTPEEYAALASTPLWMVQVDDDTLVEVDAHIKSTWPRILAAGALDAHLTYYDHIEDETGRYRAASGEPTRYNGHFVWINVYHDTCRTELDGTNVLWEGFPVTLWQWVGRHSRRTA